MGDGLVQTIMSCIKYEINGQDEKIVLPNISADFMFRLYNLSKSHDIAHLVGDALSKSGIYERLFDSVADDERELILNIKGKFDEQLFMAISRYENIHYELELLQRTLEQAKISFILLKGAVVRKYYPSPWQRTSCDIDILVHEKDLDEATKILVTELGYEKQSKGSHDVGLFAASGVHVELHYSLIESEKRGRADRPLKVVWQEAVSINGTSRYEISNDMMYYYHIAHMAKHFMIGGHGIRFVIDLWILNNKMVFDEKKSNALLEQGGLLKFAQQMVKLSDVWFGNAAHSETSKLLEEYILSSGIYGTVENNILVQQDRRGGKFKYIVSRIWLPYDKIKYHYPILGKYKILFPFCQIMRWFKLLFTGGVKRGVKELKMDKNMSRDRVDSIKLLLDELCL